MSVSMRFSFLFLLFSVYCQEYNNSVGIIGLTSEAADRLGNIDVPKNESGCRWYGTAPVCRGKCPAGWFKERAGQSRHHGFGLTPIFEEAFGAGCFPFTEKVFCCVANKLDRTWSGIWISGQNGGNSTCHYRPYDLTKATDESNSLCGRIECTQDIQLPALEYKIVDANCTRLRPMGEPKELEGIAKNGIIHWRNITDDKPVNRWYKFNQ